MDDANAHERTEPLRFARTFETGPDYPAQVTRAVWRNVYSQPARLVRTVILAAVVIALLVVVFASPASGSSTYKIAIVVFIVIFAGILISTYFRSRRKIAEQIPVGSLYTIGFRDDTFTVTGPLVTSTVAYRAYIKAYRQGDFVFLTSRATKRSSAFPGELFTPESLAWMQSKLTP
jgi:hypothetical protein